MKITDYDLYTLLGHKVRLYDPSCGHQVIGVVAPTPPTETRAKYGVAYRENGEGTEEISLLNLYLRDLRSIKEEDGQLTILTEWPYGGTGFVLNSEKAQGLERLLKAQEL